jgi:hypothetical protein
MSIGIGSSEITSNKPVPASGSSVEVNGGSALTTANLNATTPAVSNDTVSQNVTWQVSGSSVSANVPIGGPPRPRYGIPHMLVFDGVENGWWQASPAAYGTPVGPTMNWVAMCNTGGNSIAYVAATATEPPYVTIS